MAHRHWSPDDSDDNRYTFTHRLRRQGYAIKKQD
jgi:hypothetical protein